MISLAEYKPYLQDYLERYHNLKNPKSFFHCLNPNHPDNHPSMMFTNKYHICKCFSCGASYDIFDLVGIDYNLDNFGDQLKKVKELYSEYVPEYNCEKKQKFDNKIHNYTWYYNRCIKNIGKCDYLQKRGITKETIEKYKIGYDEKRELVIFPITKYCYFGRSTVDKSKVKSPGSSDIWNQKYLSDNDTVIYVTESIIDGLSLEVIDSNVRVMSINGLGNLNTLVDVIKKSNFNGIIAIAFDNDYRGIEAVKKLKEELTKINVSSFPAPLISNFDSTECKDINEALLLNRELLEKNYKYFNTSFQMMLEKMKEKEKGDLCFE